MVVLIHSHPNLKLLKTFAREYSGVLMVVGALWRVLVAVVWV